MSCLKNAFTKSVNCIFKTFSDFIVAGNIVLPSQGYNPTTGQPTGTETLYPISEIIFVDYKLSKIDGQIIRSLDKQALFKFSEISVEINDQMFLRLSGGDEWDIIKSVIDPSESLYELQCRRP